MTMIRNGVTYNKLYRNGLEYAVGPVPPSVAPPPVLANGPRIVAEMKAHGAFANIAHFRTRDSTGGLRYNQRPDNANKTGEIIEEWVSALAAHAIFPLVRRVSINSTFRLQLIQFTGSNVDLGGVDIGSRDWTALVTDTASTPAGIYVVSIADSEYLCMPPLSNEDVNAARISFAAIDAITDGHSSDGLNTETEVSTWLVAERETITAAREFIIAVAADRTYIPTF